MARYTETFSRVMQGDFATATPGERQAAFLDVRQVACVSSAALTVQPIPFLDTALMAPIQIGLVQAIGRIHGYSLDRQAVLELLATFGASIVTQNVMMGALKFVPFLGWVAAPAMAYGLTFSIGEVANHYFASGRSVDTAELQAMFQEVYARTRAEKESANAENQSLKERLQELKDAFEAGLIDAETFERKKEQVLEDF